MSKSATTWSPPSSARGVWVRCTWASTSSSTSRWTKLDRQGNFLWTIHAGSTDNDEGTAVAVGATGEAYVGGTCWYSCTFYESSGGQPITYGLWATEIVVAQISPDGQFGWVYGPVGKYSEYLAALAVDQGQQLYLVGDFEWDVNFGVTYLSTPVSYPNAFLARIDPSVPQFLMAQSYGSDAGFASAWGVAVDNQGAAYLTGWYAQEAADFGDISLPVQGPYSAFVSKVSAGGTVLWAETPQGSSKAYGSAIAVDGAGHAHVAGDFYGSASFGGRTLTAGGAPSAYVWKLPAK